MNVKLQRSRRRQDVLIWAVLWYLVVCARKMCLRTLTQNDLTKHTAKQSSKYVG